MQYTKTNGNTCFKCSENQCTSSIFGRYHNYETWQNDHPKIISCPSPHMVNGIEHPPNAGKRTKQEAHRKIKKEMKEDPLKLVTLIQEEVVNGIMENLQDANKREESMMNMPKSGSSLTSLYKVRGAVLPSTPATLRAINITSR